MEHLNNIKKILKYLTTENFAQFVVESKIDIKSLDNSKVSENDSALAEACRHYGLPNNAKYRKLFQNKWKFCRVNARDIIKEQKS